MPAHSTLTGADLHEPKGVAAAAAGKSYLSDGVGSGSWLIPPYTVSMVLADVSTASTIYLPIPLAGVVTKVVTVLAGSLTTANSTVTVRNAAGASMGTLTITQSGSAAGDIDVLNPVSNNTVTNDSRISVETDGASDTVRNLFVTVYIRGS
jgi:hypothetical protein